MYFAYVFTMRMCLNICVFVGSPQFCRQGLPCWAMQKKGSLAPQAENASSVFVILVNPRLTCLEITNDLKMKQVTFGSETVFQKGGDPTGSRPDPSGGGSRVIFLTPNSTTPPRAWMGTPRSLKESLWL